MSRALVTSLIALTLVACGHGESSPPTERSPKARANDRPIEREMERRNAPRPEAHGPMAAVEAAPAPAPAAAPASAPAPAAAPAAAPAPAPASVAAAEPAPEPALPAPGDVTVARLVATVAVENREPTTAPRADAERTYAFVEAANASDADTELSIVFVNPDGEVGAPIALRLPPSRRWRTWATTRHTRGRPGAWTLIVRDAAGDELERTQFEVGAVAPVAS